MGVITGVRGTGNITQAKRIIDMGSKIAVLEPDSAPLTQLSKMLDKQVAINPTYNWLEEDSLTKADAINYTTGYTAADTSVVVDTGSLFRVGDVLKAVATGEQILVTAVSTNTLTISRAWGSTAAGLLADNAVLLIVGNANEEGATKRVFKTTNETLKTNYLQIFRTPFGVTRTNMNSEMYGGKDIAHTRMMQMIEHQKEIERAFWFGEPKEDTSGTHPKRATGGADYFISTNATDMGGAMTEIEFEAFTRQLFRYGSSVKYLFGSPLVISSLSFWGRGKLYMVPRDKTYGIAVTQYICPHGTLNIINNKIFGETTVYSGYGFGIDLESIKYRYLANSDTKLKTNIQANDADGEEDEYISEVGFQLEHEKKCAQMTNVTSFS